MKYVCVRKCLFGGQLFKPDDGLDFTGDVEKCSCENGCRKCGYSGRLVPSHHFVLASKADKEKAMIQERKVGKLAKLKEELDALGKPYDKRWPVERLELELLKAKKMGAESKEEPKAKK